MWYAKMYFSGKQEIFQYDASGTQGVPSTQVELPFLESLLSFLEMDWGEVTPALQGIAENWERLLREDDREAGTAAMVDLGQLAQRHIYLRLLYVRCYNRFSRIGADIPVSEQEDQQLLDELRHLSEQLPLYQRQVQRFFDLVLDVDSARQRSPEAGGGPLSLQFPQGPRAVRVPAHSPQLRAGGAGPVFAGALLRHHPDMIDYSLRSCVERETTVRRCKNCGRWFPQTGRVSAEYCERPVAEGQPTCREAGAFQQWTKKQSDDPVFKVYRKEYKKRFAWIKAKRITAEQFYTWSEQAREMKKKCDQEAITLEEFEDWLKNAKVPL